MSFTLCNEVWPGRRALRAVVRGIFVEGPRPTRIHCSFGLLDSTIAWIVFGTVVIPPIIAILVGSAIVTLTHAPGWEASVGTLTAWLVTLVSLIANIESGRGLAGNDEEFLLRFLLQTLNARRVPRNDIETGP